VFDASSETAEEELNSVKEVLKRLRSWDKPKIFVANKTDKLVSSPQELEELKGELLLKIPEENPKLVLISAVKGWGLEELKRAIEEALKSSPQER
jgi:GTP-binding protein HflX